MEPIHKYPVDDSKSHDTTSRIIDFNYAGFDNFGELVRKKGKRLICECECLPILKHEDGEYIFVHNRFDALDAVKSANEIINKQQ